MKGFLLGHSDNGRTGVSVLLCPLGAVGGVSVRGGAPGTRETDLLNPQNMIEKLHAVTLSGGSAFGLESACGVMRYLYEEGCGYNAGTQVVPIVCGAVIYDLLEGELIYPTADMGYEAAKNATENNLACGRVGAGVGATVGKIRAPLGVDRGGFGVTIKYEGAAFVGVAVAVNALGDVLDAQSGKIIAGARTQSGDFLDSTRAILEGKIEPKERATNTTIGAVFTNIKITKAQASKLADAAHDGLARSVSPAHTMLDGDTFFALSTNQVDMDFNRLCVLAAQITSHAITKAVLK